MRDPRYLGVTGSRNVGFRFAWTFLQSDYGLLTVCDGIGAWRKGRCARVAKKKKKKGGCVVCFIQVLREYRYLHPAKLTVAKSLTAQDLYRGLF